MTFTLTSFIPHPSISQPVVIAPGRCHVFVWCHQLSLDEFTALCRDAGVVVEDDVQCAKRRIERLSSLFMLHQLLGPEARLVHAPTGRPQIEGSPLHLSISHTDGAYALSLSHEVHGIDIEHPSPRALRLRTRFLNEEERHIRLGNDWTAEDEATALWCAKEAAYKCFSSESITHIGQVQLRQVEPEAPLTATPEGINGPDFRITFARPFGLIIALWHP